MGGALCDPVASDDSGGLPCMSITFAKVRLRMSAFSSWLSDIDVRMYSIGSAEEEGGLRYLFGAELWPPLSKLFFALAPSFLSLAILLHSRGLLL